MKKTFNTTGLCFPHLHYMVDVTAKLQAVLDLVENEKYFTINRPRQYGKTTLLYLLENTLKEKDNYTVIALNFQGIDNKWYQSDAAFAQMVVQELTDELIANDRSLISFLQRAAATVSDMRTLSIFVTNLINHLGKEIILLVDEVDASSNFEPFLKFLGMLRTKYLKRHKSNHRTFQSVVLAGVHDVKTLKFKINDDSDNEYNSPWNIAVDFKVTMSFSVNEIATMLQDYAQSESVDLAIPAIAERLYYYTAGYPFLVSKICETVVQILANLPATQQHHWQLEHVDAAVRKLMKQNNTNFDSLIANLEKNKDLYRLVHRILIAGDSIPFNQHNPTIHRGVQYGIFARRDNLEIHNRIYEQIIYNYLTSKVATQISSAYNYNDHFLADGHRLDLVAVLKRFQIFMREQYSQRNTTFLEEHGRLIFLAFFAPILNGKGHAFREVQTSMEKRLDIVVTYLQHKYVIELKRWYGSEAHTQGLNQLADYLTAQNLEEGYLLIYDFRKNKTWQTEWIDWQGKRIFAVWV